MPEKKEITEKYPEVTVIGAGTIGISWAALFLANGLKVTVNDPRPDLEEATLKGIGEMSHTLKSLGYDDKEITKNLSFEKDLDRAVKGSDIIQENGPENIDFKQDLYARIETNVKSSALVLSSSSGITSSLFTKNMTDAGKVLIGHPFNPPHIIPLVEVLPGARQTKEAI